MKKYGKKLLTFLVCAAMLLQSGAVTSRAETPTDAVPEPVTERAGLEELEGIEISDEAAQALLEEPEPQEGINEIAVQSRNWDQYGSDYVYNTYLTDAEKAFYDGLEEECKNVINTDVNLQEYSYNGETDYLLTDVSYDGLEYETARGLLYVFLYQNPQYYFVSSAYLYSKTSKTIWMMAYPVFADGENRAAETEKLFARADRWIDEINQETTTLEKEKKAHDIICVNTTYDDGDYDQSAYSMIVQGQTVCAGYTKTFSLLANAVGIDTIGINGSNHGWNMSCIDGIWYNVDVTWDDSDNYIGYGFFNRSDDKFSSGHEPYAWFKNRIPAATSDRTATYWTEDAVYVDAVTLDRSELTMGTTGTVALNASIHPENAIDTAVAWASSDENVATVSQTGVVTPKNVGTATITVTTNNRYKSAQCTVTVKTDATVTTSGIFIASHTRDTIVAGMVAAPSKSADLEYRWLACDTSTDANTWIEIQGWTRNNEWLNWTTQKGGDYVIVGQVRVVGNESSQAQSSVGISHHPQIKGKCQMPYTGAGGGYLIGIESYDNPNREYSYELLVLDCTLLAQGKDAWIWTTGRCGAPDNAFWAVWQPQYGYYWTLFRVYDKDGTLIDQECYPFVNAY